MLNQRARIFTVSLPVALMIIVQTLALFPSKAAAQCPTMSAEGATFGITQFNTVKSQMWYNDGVWWGVFSDLTTGIHFYSFPNNSAVQGPIFDATITGIPDALWDGTSLSVMVWKSVSLATFYKFTYNSVTKTYSLISGFPVQIPLNGSSTAAMVIEQDTTGKMWATYTGTQGGLSDGKIRVIWTTSADQKVWDTTGTTLESGLTPNTLEISTITQFGGNKIGVAWSNQPGKEIAFRYHIDGDPEATWSTKEVIDSGIGPRGLGPVSDDHLAMKGAPDGRIFLVAKDNDNDGTPAHATEGRIWLYIRTAAGTWGQKTIIQPDFSQLPTRPVILMDTFNSRLYVIYHDDSLSGSGRNFIAHTSMDNPFFDFPCVFNVTASSNPTSTKQYVNPTTGIMAVASTGSTGSGELVFRSVSLPSDNPIPSIASLAPSSGLAGGAGFTLTVNGSGFINGSVVRWNGNDRLTTFVSSTQLTASILPSDILFAGNAFVSVFTDAPGGGLSNEVAFAINNPLPTLSSISPTIKTAGNPAFTLTVNGTDFLNTSVVSFNGSDRPTTFVNSTQLTAQITAADIQAGGTFPIRVFTPGPGGGLSSNIDLTVDNPIPVLNTISPNIKTVGDPAFTLTIDGTNFMNGSIVRFNGSNRTTTFFGSTQLTAQLTAADLQTAGTFPITVFNPLPGGGTSNAVNLTVNNPSPNLSSISPNSKTAGDPAFTLTVNGSSFVNGSVVRFNGSDRTTTFVNSTQLTAQITQADVQAAGSFAITVFSPGPGGGVSSAINLNVAGANNPPPSLASMSPTSKTAGDAAFMLTVNGSNFIASSVVQWNNSARTTTFVNSAQLTAQITAADVASAGSASVTVFNPQPGGGASGALTFTINPPVATGYESDVAPRPNGSNNGTITISDWVQTGRFSAGLDVPTVGSEFQRADSAPKGTFGNGLITVSDWVQAGRYAAGLDPVVPVGGPTGPLVATQILDSKANLTPDEAAAGRIIRIAGTSCNAGQACSVAIELDSQGDENALGLSVTFDTTKLTYVSALPGTGATGTVMNVNASAVGAGKLGIAMSQPAGLSFATGTRQLVILAFNVAANASGSTTIGFGDSPIAREVVGVVAEELAATFNGTTLNIIPASNPVPAITSINPTSAAVGGAGFTLTVNGSNFISGSVVRWNGADRATTFVNSNQLTAQILAGDLQSATTAAITVSNPSPAGGISNIVNFDVTNPTPSVSSLAPASAVAGGAAFTLTVNGSNFVNGSVVSWNGDARITTFVSSTQLTAQITATDVLTAGTSAVTVTTPGPGGGVSGTLSFSVNNPSPSLTSLAPASVVAGGTTFTLTVNGNGFVNGAVVRLNGANRSTTFVSSTQLTAQIPASDILTAGSAAITVFNPSPGGGASSSLSLAVNNPSPSLNSLAPASIVTGGAAFTLTVNGSNFVSGAVVRWNGSDRATTFVNSTQLTAQITAADISAVSTASVTVFNPLPGGGLSTAVTFSITPVPTTLQFSAANFSISEDGGSAVISITRTGDTSAAATVDFGIADPVGYVPCDIASGHTAQNCDYTITAAALHFAPGETTKNATIPIINDAYVEGNELLNLKLSNPQGASLGAQSTATLTITDNDSVNPPVVNPIDQTQLFVRQQYLDFLGREPDQGGLAFWSNEINSCPQGDQLCLNARRIRVADAFFFEPEFQETGAYVYRIYRAGLGITPSYVQFQPDRALVLGGANLDQSKTAFALNFVQRLAFLQTHGPTQTAEQFVDQLLAGVLQNSGVDLSASRNALLALYDGTDNGRAAILRQVADDPRFVDAEYNRSFVLNEYFGYLRRDPDQGGYDFWLGQVNRYPLRDVNVQHAMVCSFITSTEYQYRFSSFVTASNAQCPQ